jgi:hypothetical protein
MAWRCEAGIAAPWVDRYLPVMSDSLKHGHENGTSFDVGFGDSSRCRRSHANWRNQIRGGTDQESGVAV